MAPWAVRPTSDVAEPCRRVVREEARCGNSEPPLIDTESSTEGLKMATERQPILASAAPGNPALPIPTAPFAGLVLLADHVAHSRPDPSRHGVRQRAYHAHARAAAAERRARRDVAA